MENSRNMSSWVNSWLWITCLINFLLCLYCSIVEFAINDYPSSLGLGLLSVFALGCLLSSILIMRWNRIGVYVMAVFTLLAIVVNYLLVELNSILFLSALLFLLTLLVLFIPKEGVTTWALLEDGWDYLHCRHLYQFFGALAFILLGLTAFVSISDAQSGNSFAEKNDWEYEKKDSLEVFVEETCEYFYADNGTCMIAVPQNYAKTNIADGQILGLSRTDDDPALFVMQESVNDVNSSGITTLERYANAVVNANRKADDAENFVKIRETDYNGGYLIVYDLTVGGLEIRYNLLAVKDSSNYYYCMVYCLRDLAENLQPVIYNILDSFELTELDTPAE